MCSGRTAAPVLPQDHRLAVDQRLVCREAARRLGDRREAIGEVRAASAPDPLALALLAGEEREEPGWIESNTARNLSIFRQPRTNGATM
jgi:hypothetical protein